MASGLPATEVHGINLENYYPGKRSYNSVSYVHKKFLNNPKEKRTAVPDLSENIDNHDPKTTARNKKSKRGRSNHHKVSKTEIDNDQTSVNNDEVLGQTIRFAKNIVPIVIPPSANDSCPVYYTIKTSRKSRLGNKSKDYTVTQDSTTYRKQQEKKIIETFRKENFKSHTESSRESISRSSVENIVISQSLNSTISEISERRARKTRRSDKRCNKSHVAVSESLEALATELLHTSGEAKIKIHLMDDTAKDLFYESIQKPVIEAIRQSIAEVMHSKETEDSKTVYRYVQCHTQKIDSILDKLTCIEKRLDGDNEKVKPHKGRGKASALEEIGEDMTEENDDLEDVAVVYNAAEQRRSRCASAVNRFNPLQKIEEVSPCGGDGEDIISHKAMAPMSVRPEKIPTRYCWTDSTNQ